MPLFRLGAISHEWFLKLSAKYEVEQKELTEKAKVDQAMVRYLRADFDSFAVAIWKCVDITQLMAK